MPLVSLVRELLEENVESGSSVERQLENAKHSIRNNNTGTGKQWKEPVIEKLYLEGETRSLDELYKQIEGTDQEITRHSFSRGLNQMWRFNVLEKNRDYRNVYYSLTEIGETAYEEVYLDSES